MRNDIKRKVNNLVSRYGTRDPYKLCKNTNVLVNIGDLGNILGCYLLIKRQKCIMLNECVIGTPLENVVLSHELGHSVMHRNNNCYFYGSTFFIKEKEELEANTFAAELLIPDDLILDNPDFSRQQIARLAGCSEKIMDFKKI